MGAYIGHNWLLEGNFKAGKLQGFARLIKISQFSSNITIREGFYKAGVANGDFKQTKIVVDHELSPYMLQVVENSTRVETRFKVKSNVFDMEQKEPVMRKITESDGTVTEGEAKWINTTSH